MGAVLRAGGKRAHFNPWQRGARSWQGRETGWGGKENQKPEEEKIVLQIPNGEETEGEEKPREPRDVTATAAVTNHTEITPLGIVTMALQEPIRKRRLKPKRPRTRTQACLSEARGRHSAGETRRRRAAGGHATTEAPAVPGGKVCVSTGKDSIMSWRVSVTEPRTRLHRRGGLARSERWTELGRHRSCPHGAHQTVQRSAGDRAAQGDLDWLHRTASSREGRGPLALRQRPRNAQTRVLRSCPAPTRNGLPLPRPPRCSGPAPRRLPRADALLATGQSKELTETGRAGAAPRVGRRDPGHLPHGRAAAHHPRTAPQAAPDRLPELPG